MMKRREPSDETLLVFSMQTPQDQRSKCSYASVDMSRKPLTHSLTNMEVKKDFGLTRIQSQDALSVTLARVSPSFDWKDYSPTVV